MQMKLWDCEVVVSFETNITDYIYMDIYKRQLQNLIPIMMWLSRQHFCSWKRADIIPRHPGEHDQDTGDGFSATTASF